MFFATFLAFCDALQRLLESFFSFLQVFVESFASLVGPFGVLLHERLEFLAGLGHLFFVMRLQLCGGRPTISLSSGGLSSDGLP